MRSAAFMLNWNFGIAAVNWRAMFCSSHRRHRTSRRAGDTSCFLNTAKRLLERTGRPRLVLSRLFLFASMTAFAWDAALAQTATNAEPKQTSATAADTSCPSQNFREFFKAFAESAELQRKYTSIPFERKFLAYGGGEANDFLKSKKYSSFEKIPTYRIGKGGAAYVIPNRTCRKERELKFTITTMENSRKKDSWAPELVVRSSDRATVLLQKEDSDVFIVTHLFRKEQSCWYLFSMIDRSV